MRKPKLRELKFAIEALIKGPYTSKFPKAPPIVPEHFRGVPTYVPDDCVGCGACGQVCPAGAITIVDEYREDKKRMVRRIERNWGNCIMCSQCFVYCITKKGIVLDKDFDKSTTDPADFIDTQDKELLFCEHCGSPDHDGRSRALVHGQARRARLREPDVHGRAAQGARTSRRTRRPAAATGRSTGAISCARSARTAAPRTSCPTNGERAESSAAHILTMGAPSRGPFYG